jgi:uncharacterized protein (UPF0332 family)
LCFGDATSVTQARGVRRIGHPDFGAQASPAPPTPAFHAAEAALLHVGQTRAEHAGVVSAVGRLLMRERGLDERASRLLRSLLQRRSPADYGLADVPDDEARQPSTTPKLSVDTIEA